MVSVNRPSSPDLGKDITGIRAQSVHRLFQQLFQSHALRIQVLHNLLLALHSTESGLAIWGPPLLFLPEVYLNTPMVKRSVAADCSNRHSSNEMYAC